MKAALIFAVLYAAACWCVFCVPMPDGVIEQAMPALQENLLRP